MNDTLVFYGLVDDDEVPVDAVALELSALDHDGVSTGTYLDQINRMAARVLTLSADMHTPAEKSTVLAHVIARENAFTGDRQSYDAPVNADMIRVFDRRKGLPISLAIIYVAVARRLGWTSYVINLPGHVLVSLGEIEPVLIDAFNDGALIDVDEWDGAKTMDDRRKTMTQQALRMSNRDVLVRLLQNQASRAEQDHDRERALALYERMKTIAPGNPQGWTALARVQIQIGAHAQARKNLIALLEMTRNPGSRAQISHALGALAGT